MARKPPPVPTITVTKLPIFVQKCACGAVILSSVAERLHTCPEPTQPRLVTVRSEPSLGRLR